MDTLTPIDESWKPVTDHAWRYFELHATQRMTLFNYFTFFAGLMSAGIASTLQSNGTFALLGLVLGGLLAVSSFVFWKLDQRASFLVKSAELVLAEAERTTLPAGARLFANEPIATLAATRGGLHATSLWTFGSSFRLVFALAGLIGVSSSILAGMKAGGIAFNDKPATIEKVRSEDAAAGTAASPKSN